jgi:hypothetical protein
VLGVIRSSSRRVGAPRVAQAVGVVGIGMSILLLLHGWC